MQNFSLAMATAFWNYNEKRGEMFLAETRYVCRAGVYCNVNMQLTSWDRWWWSLLAGLEWRPDAAHCYNTRYSSSAAACSSLHLPNLLYSVRVWYTLHAVTNTSPSPSLACTRWLPQYGHWQTGTFGTVCQKRGTIILLNFPQFYNDQRILIKSCIIGTDCNSALRQQLINR